MQPNSSSARPLSTESGMPSPSVKKRSHDQSGRAWTSS